MTAAQKTEKFADGGQSSEAPVGGFWRGRLRFGFTARGAGGTDREFCGGGGRRGGGRGLLAPLGSVGVAGDGGDDPVHLILHLLHLVAVLQEENREVVSKTEPHWGGGGRALPECTGEDEDENDHKDSNHHDCDHNISDGWKHFTHAESILESAHQPKANVIKTTDSIYHRRSFQIQDRVLSVPQGHRWGTDGPHLTEATPPPTQDPQILKDTTSTAGLKTRTVLTESDPQPAGLYGDNLGAISSVQNTKFLKLETNLKQKKTFETKI